MSAADTRTPRRLALSTKDIENAVAAVVREWGFEVDLVPEADGKRPDLLVKGDLRYAIEIKTKEEDPATVAARGQTLTKGEIAEITTPFIPKNRLSAILKDGVAQLKSFPDERDLSLLWMIAVGADDEAQCEQIRSTLYGLTNVVGPDVGVRIPCYYFRNSAFFRWREYLDGAVVGTLDGGSLCINSYSPRWELIATSDFAARFGSAVVSPIDIERRGEAYIADCELDRKDEDEILKFVARKYGRADLMTFDLGSIRAYLELSPDD
jgi:hypothetical protein